MIRKVERILQKRQINAAQKYARMVEYLNMVHGYDRFATADTPQDIKVLGVGGFGILLLVLGCGLKALPFAVSTMDFIPYSIFGIVPSLQMLVNIFTTTGFVVSFMGYKLAYKYRKEHFGASAAVTVYLDVMVPILSILLLVLIASWFFPPIAANIFRGEPIYWG